MKFSRVERRERPQRRGAHRRARDPRAGRAARRRACRRGTAPSAATTSTLERGVEVRGVAMHACSSAAAARRRRCAPSARTASIATPRSPARRRSRAAAPSTAAGSFERAEPLRGERARVQVARPPRKRQQRGQRALVLEPLQRVRHGPPAHRRLAGRVEHGGRERRVRLQPHERVERRGGTARRRAARAYVDVVRVQMRERARPHARRPPSRRSPAPRRVADAAPSASAARPCTSGDGSAERARQRVARAARRRAGRARTPPSAAPRARRPASSADERRHAVAQADAPDRQRRAAPDARLVVREQARRGRSGGSGAIDRLRPAPAAGGGRRYRGARAGPRAAGSAPSSARRSTARWRSARRPRAGGDAARRRRQPRWRAAIGGAGASGSRRAPATSHAASVARSTRSSHDRRRRCRARRAPAIVPSAATSIGGSIRSGSK